MGIRKRMFTLLRGDTPSPAEDSGEPHEIGYVPLVLSELYASALREAGFHAHAIAETRVGPIGSISLQPMARIYVPKREVAEAQPMLDEMSGP